MLHDRGKKDKPKMPLSHAAAVQALRQSVEAQLELLGFQAQFLHYIGTCGRRRRRDDTAGPPRGADGCRSPRRPPRRD